MQLAQDLSISSLGHALDTSEHSFGELTESSHLLDNAPALRTSFADNGYLYLRGFFRRDDVMATRRSLVERLEALGYFQPGTDPMDCIARDGSKSSNFRPEITENNPEIQKLLYSGRIMDFYREFFGEAVRHYDFTWLRSMTPGNSSSPHCDMVYMGRGTREKLMTAWIPMGDAPLHIGGLIVLEGSHLQHERLRHYLERDVDTYCSNRPEKTEIEDALRRGEWKHYWPGCLTNNPTSLREKLGGRWLTAEFQAGDLLTFGMYTVHGSIDNRSDRVRISTDSRYQPASLPADERWIGEKPVGHSLAGKRGRVC